MLSDPSDSKRRFNIDLKQVKENTLLLIFNIDEVH